MANWHGLYLSSFHIDRWYLNRGFFSKTSIERVGLGPLACRAFGGGFEHRQNVGDLLGDQVANLEVRSDEPMIAHMGKEIEQRTPKSGDIDDEHGLAVSVELDPGQLLDEFFERADPAGQGHEGIGALEHQALAGMHVGHDDELLGLLQHQFSRLQKIGDDAGDMAAMRQHASRHFTHEAGVAAAIDEPDLGLGQGPAQDACRMYEERIGTGGRAAIDADVSNRSHREASRKAERVRSRAGIRARRPHVVRASQMWHFSRRGASLANQPGRDRNARPHERRDLRNRRGGGHCRGRRARLSRLASGQGRLQSLRRRPRRRRPALLLVTAGAADHPQAEQAAPTAPQARQPALPGFDVVRVEPTGDTVVAGRAAPNAEVALLDRGNVIAETKADANGQFAFVPPPLPAGDHLLALGEKSGEGQVISAQTVTVAVPKTKSAGDVVAALTEPDQPTRLLSAPPQPAPAADTPQKAAETSGNCLEVARGFISLLQSGRANPMELVLKRHITHEADEYANNSISAIVSKMVEEMGVHLSAGESIEFIILDQSGKKKPEKAKPIALYAFEDGYDIEQYTELALRAVETLLLPFGYDIDTSEITLRH